ncbi:MAG: hypothetical protein ACI33J_04520 [Clostridium sp.]
MDLFLEGQKTEALSNELIYMIDNSFITIGTIKSIKCEDVRSMDLSCNKIGCNNRIVLNENLERREYIECPYCGNCYEYEDIESKIREEYEITEIKDKIIISNVIDKIKGQKCDVKQITSRNYIMTIEEKKYLIIFDGKIDRPINELDDLIIIIDIKIRPKKYNLPAQSRSVSAFSILKNGFKKMFDQVKYLESYTDIEDRIKKVNNVEKRIINDSKVIKWQLIEKDYAMFFLDKIRSSRKEIAKYKYLLSNYPHLGIIPLSSGGAGNPDGVSIDIYKYLSEVFEGKFTSDAKRYSVSKVDSNQMEKVLHHLSKSQFDEERVVVVATTNDVTCWNTIKSFQIDGSYRIILFTPRIMAEVAVQLKFDIELLGLLSRLKEESLLKE